MLKTSAGILILCNEKALLAHSTNAPWWRSYTPPKGGLEHNESLEEAASREVFEEVGILVDPSVLTESVEVEYRHPNGKLYKVVHLFLHRIANFEEIGLKDEHVPFSQLQREEVDEARFMSYEEVEKKALPRYLSYILPLLDERR
jgi:ADP-ribose pyrophosphatase YjhB (NUDIX family)